MVTATEDHTRSSVHVKPLNIHKDLSRHTSDASRHTRDSSRGGSRPVTSSSHSQITPPATPNGSKEDLTEQINDVRPVFHNFLRAFYPFHPTYTISDTTVTLPLNEGDVILVHSIHTNGWADGTLLVSGARGWLPTNYCEAYDPEPMRNLLKALLNFWDLLRSGLTNDSEVFGNQEFMRGIIAGVRYLLEKSNCLTREASIVQSNEGLRRNRKALLSDLSALVKTAKRLQEVTTSPTPSKAEAEVINSILDDMILKAFRIVIRGVRFLDSLELDSGSRQPVQQATRVMARLAEEVHNPPTPPADSTSFEDTQGLDSTQGTASRESSAQGSADNMSHPQKPEDQTKPPLHKRLSSANPNNSRPISISMKRQSISHRLSASVPAAQRKNLVSERLNISHDTFLSYLGSFIGRLHLQSQSSSELVHTIKQSVTAGRELLRVVEAVCAHDNQSAESLEEARGSVYEKVNKLVLAARDIMASDNEGEGVVMPQQNGRLLMAATGCVKAVGECVAKAKFVIERTGDFEFEEAQETGLSIGVPSTGAGPEQPQQHGAKEAPSTETVSRPQPPPLLIPTFEKKKSLPDPPLLSSSTAHTSASASPKDSGSPADYESVATTISTQRSSGGLLPPLPKMTSPLMGGHNDEGPSDQFTSPHGDFQASYRSGSVAASSTGTSSTYVSSTRDSESSITSRTSTRATTPDLAPHVPRNQPSPSDLSAAGSQSTLMDDADDGESKMLEKTFAHEMMLNKEGQITGGTLSALVERLTTHDSTPDAMFVSTFYLTFRLFVTPVDLAKALVDRFDYVTESPHIAAPVRLRVYNVFKGWLESHWRDLSDHAALATIYPFAEENLGKHLPAAGRRLLELSQKVSSNEGPLVPRLVSSMGKTSTATAQYIPADTPLPPPIMNRSQTNALRNWKMGGSNPSILEFDPLELARQLTIKEMNIFCSIMPEELLGSEWTKRSRSNAINVRAMSTLSTDLSNLVADTILHHEDAKKRAVVIKHWIKIASKCLELHNYDTLLAIICSLNSSTIIRLKKTWEIVSQKRKDMLKVLQTVVEPDKNYVTLRRRLHDHVPPCLPFVGTYLTDLTFVDAGNPATKQLPGIGDHESISVINFDKHTRTAKIIGELQRFQLPYRLTEVPEIQEWLQAQVVRVKSTSEIENVQQYYRKSLLLEPRESMQPRPSPIESQHSGHSATKEKFDIFAWTHTRERTPANMQRTPLSAQS